MPTVRIPLVRPVPEPLAPDLARRLYFISDKIEGFELLGSDGTVDVVEVTLADADAETAVAIERQINRVVAQEITGQRPMPPKVRWSSPADGRAIADPFPRLLDHGCAFVSGEGQVGFGEPLISLMDYLDHKLRGIAFSLGGTSEYQYPTLLPTSVLERFGYFGTFPQFPMFVTRLHNDLDVYEEFVEKYLATQRLPDDLFERCSSRDYCLPPTMCYHTYHQLQGRALDRDTVVTARGKSFRYESKYHVSLERLWDFTIREIVFMGGQEFVTRSRESVMAQAFALMEDLDLAGRCEPANDPFFASADTVGKIFSQRLMELKFELLLPVAHGRSVAAGSFNLHGTFFGESFGITRPDGKPVASGCVGFGLERLVYAFLCQHGTDAGQWPVSVREAGVGERS